jgi:RNA polymerase sigma-70 factor (ECF subfamily)
VSVTDPAEIAAIYRREYGRAVAALTRVLGDLDLAEDAVQDAFGVALEHWSTHGLPPSPAGWIITTARRRAIDRLRKDSSRLDRHRRALLTDPPPEDPVDALLDDSIADDLLRLIFTCCHPALAGASRVALSLRLLCGLTTAEVARAFLVSESTMAQRIVRAKAKIRDAGVPYRIPRAAELPDRLAAVLAVVYLIFTEAHTATSGPDLTRPDLAAEAIRLARLLVGLLPDEPEARGMLALLLLTDARRRARTDGEGRLVRLADQDRTRWDAGQIAEGLAILDGLGRYPGPGPYRLQAEIAAVHARAATAEATDWALVVALYDRLLALTPTPSVALNRAVAVAEVEGAEAALRLVDGIGSDLGPLRESVRAELLWRLGRAEEAAAAYERAIGAAGNDVEREFLRARRDDLVELISRSS